MCDQEKVLVNGIYLDCKKIKDKRKEEKKSR